MNRILIVEDAPVQSISLMMSLKRLYPDAEFDTAHNFKSAVEHVRNNKYDLYFLDVDLSEDHPDRNGYTISRLIRNNPENEFTPIIFTTACSADLSYDSFGRKCISNHSFLIKPYEFSQIPDAIQDAMKTTPICATANIPIKRLLPLRVRYSLDEIQYIRFGLFFNYIVTKNEVRRVYGHPVEVIHPIVGNTFLLCREDYLINLQAVQSYDKEKHAVKINNQNIRVRRRYRKLLEDMFG